MSLGTSYPIESDAAAFCGQGFTLAGARITYGMIAVLLLYAAVAFALNETWWGRHVDAVVIGGTSLFGGRGSVVGTLIGTPIIATLRNGLTLQGSDPLWQDLVTGVLVILAVAVDQLYRRGRCDGPGYEHRLRGPRPHQALRSRDGARRHRLRAAGRRGDGGHRRQRRRQGIETVYQELAVAPPLDITANLFLGRETLRPGLLGRFLGMLDKPAMRARTIEHMQALRFNIPSIGSAVEVLSGGQRQDAAVARAGAFGRRLVIMDEPTAVLGVRESGQVLDLIRTIRDRGLPVVLISHNMPHAFEIADRIHIQRLGRRIALIRPRDHAMAEAVAIMTGAAAAPEVAAA